MNFDPQADTSSRDFGSERSFSHAFVPGSNDVIIGKGKKANDHIGTKMLHCILLSRLNEYSQAKTKDEKSDIISSIVSQVRLTGSFIKMDKKSGLYFDVGNFFAREKISRMFRDYLGEKYKSSTVSRRKKCYELKVQMKQEGRRSHGYLMQKFELEDRRLNSVGPDDESSIEDITGLGTEIQASHRMEMNQVSTKSLELTGHKTLEYEDSLQILLSIATNQIEGEDGQDPDLFDGVNANETELLEELDVTGLKSYDLFFDEDALKDTFSSY